MTAFSTINLDWRQHRSVSTPTASWRLSPVRRWLVLVREPTRLFPKRLAYRPVRYELRSYRNALNA